MFYLSVGTVRCPSLNLEIVILNLLLNEWIRFVSRLFGLTKRSVSLKVRGTGWTGSAGLIFRSKIRSHMWGKIDR